jgi:hypothetical protein
MAASDYVPNLPDLPLASFGASTDGKLTFCLEQLHLQGILGEMMLDANIVQ